MIALVDVNNFYVSCERLFNKRIQNKPVVVLSNNDGCIISRSDEAKKIGIKMGMPFFKAKKLITEHNVTVYSSNYPLYADLSGRVMNFLNQYSVVQEVYSIDECFLKLNQQEYLDYGYSIRYEVFKNLGLPVCVGIGKTKTLAKLANYIAKKYNVYEGVVSFEGPYRKDLEQIMIETSISNLWGVGGRLTKKINELGIYSIWELKLANPKWIKQLFGINIERMVYELNGVSCYPVTSKKLPQKQIICSRSFGQKIRDFKSMADALITFVQKASLKLRTQGLQTNQIFIFIRNNRFAEKRLIENSITMRCEYYTNDSRILNRLVIEGLKKIYKNDIDYHKAGIILDNLKESFGVNYDYNKEVAESKLIDTLDAINRKYAKDMIVSGWQNKNPLWGMKQLNKSKRYTTSWNELLEVG